MPHYTEAQKTMSETKNPNPEKFPLAPTSGNTQKKPYLKPAFRHEQVFETMALACGKLNPTQSTCRTNRKTS